ncbi:hypothetical protein ACFXHA_40900 [Nocardia sp. NPDC059240]|uniref:hypothetical protein n=1 Tax=Nocardia sp. NPDC059240 TaxID=3346786 RepID=UPI003686E93B
MTYQFPEHQPYKLPPREKTINGKVVAIIVGASALGLCTLGARGGLAGPTGRGAVVSGDKKATTGKPGSPISVSAMATTTYVPPKPTVVYDVPTVDLLGVDLTVTDKKCYGSAGCNFKYDLAVNLTTHLNSTRRSPTASRSWWARERRGSE